MAYKLEDVTVLLVEDLEPMLTLTKSILNIFGFKNLIGARSGEEGFQLYKEHKPDIIITDWLMEPTDGLTMIEWIRKDPDSHNPFIPIILMTGFSNRARVVRARDMGVTEIMVKPYAARDLYNRIVQIIEKPRQFVDSAEFFGPDRRRRSSLDFEGPKRRDDDSAVEEIGDDEKKVAHEVLKKLREGTKNI